MMQALGHYVQIRGRVYGSRACQAEGAAPPYRRFTASLVMPKLGIMEQPASVTPPLWSRGFVPLVASLIAVSLWIAPSLGQAEPAAQLVIRTLAGNGTAGFSGDGGPASDAQLRFPRGVAADPEDNVLIADQGNNRIRRIDRGGVIQTVAGSGVGAYLGSISLPLDGRLLGDGRPATEAILSAPSDVAIGPDGTLYIADTGNHRIRRVDSAGIISTVAGTGEARFAGDGGPAAAASLNTPTGMAFDAAGDLYIADHYNLRVRKVFMATGSITTVAGNGAFGGGGDGGPATEASVFFPDDVAIDMAGQILIADHYGQRVRIVNALGVISTLGGRGVRADDGDGGSAENAGVGDPLGVISDLEGGVLVSQRYGSRIRRIAPDGTILGIAGLGFDGFSGDDGPAGEASLNGPVGLAWDARGSLLIADSTNHRIRIVAQQ